MLLNDWDKALFSQGRAVRRAATKWPPSPALHKRGKISQ